MENALFDFISQHMPLLEEEKKALSDLNVFRTYKKGQVLLQQGDRSQEGYFVLKGCLRVYYTIDGEEKTTAFYTEMEGLTPHCVVTKQASDYSVSCIEDCILTVSTPGMEEKMFREFPRFETLCRILSEKLLLKSQSNLDEFKTSSPEQRYLNLLKNRPDLVQRVPQHQLASYLGITPPSLSRLRARLIENKK